MAIATAGIINQEWASLLNNWIAGDGYVDYLILPGGGYSVDPEDAQVIRSTYAYLDSITGLKIRETTDAKRADVAIGQAVDKSIFDPGAPERTLGATAIRNVDGRDLMLILYFDQEADNTVIMHEIAHTIGLGHPYGDGFNSQYTRDDTIMSYNYGSTSEPGYTQSDIAALRYLWGEAGTNYDAEIARPATQDEPNQAPATQDAPSQVSVDSFSYHELRRFARSWINAANKTPISPEKNSKKIIGTDDDDNIKLWRESKGYLIEAKGGDDYIGGSKFKDKIYGGRGADYINLPKAGKRDKDKIYLEKASSPYQADVLRGLQKFDRVYIAGGSGQISVNAMSDGLGIYDGDDLCGIYIGKDLSAATLARMVSSI